MPIRDWIHVTDFGPILWRWSCPCCDDGAEAKSWGDAEEELAKHVRYEHPRFSWGDQ